MKPEIVGVSTGMTLNAGVLRRIARLAHDRMTDLGLREMQIDMDGLVAIMFSAAALEAFINELGALACRSTDGAEFVYGFASTWTGLEDARQSTVAKFAGAGEAFGNSYDKGAEPFQGLTLLFGVRDALVHLKAEELEFNRSKAPKTWRSTHDTVLETMRSKQVLAEYDPTEYINTAPAWISLFSTRAVAQWACNVAADCVAMVLDSIPDSQFKTEAEFGYRENFRRI